MFLLRCGHPCGQAGSRLSQGATNQVDIGHLALAVVHGVGMKEAPTLVDRISSLPRSLFRFKRNQASENLLAGLAEGTDWTMVPGQDELDLLPRGRIVFMADTFGAGLAALIDGLATDEFDGQKSLALSIGISNKGPRATIVYQGDHATIEVSFEPPGNERDHPAYERRLTLDTGLLHQLAEIIRRD